MIRSALSMACGILVTFLAVCFVAVSPLANQNPAAGWLAIGLVLLAGSWVASRATLYRPRP